MSAARFNDVLSPLSPGQRVSAAINASRLNALATLAQEAASGRHIRGCGGIRVKSGVQGVTITQRKGPPRGGAGAARPLEARVRAVGGGLKVTVEPSTVFGEMPEISGTAISAMPRPTLTLPASGTRHLVLNIALSFTLTEGFVHPIVSVVSITLTLETSVPSSGDLISDSGNYKVLLASFEDGSRTVQNGYGPISGELCDTLTGEGSASLNLTWSNWP